jgi:prevent-host-death family protein
MSTLTFRNRRGELVDIPSVPATQAKNALGAILEQAAARGAVAITRHQSPKAVLLSYEEFESLAAARGASLPALEAEFDGLLARLQAPAARKGLADAFDASPAELGRAAVAAARTAAARKAAVRGTAVRGAAARAGTSRGRSAPARGAGRAAKRR